jgi:tetratricopeptide (TPR) repeat protein
VREIGVRLGASTLLEGSVRRDGNRVRVSAQHVSALNGYHLWSECYDREFADIFAIQENIARAIALALRLQPSPKPIVERLTDDMEAYKLWLQGRHAAAQLTPQSVANARECFVAAIARDPQFPLPYLAIAELLFDASQFGMVPPAEAVSEAKAAVLKTLSLNDALGEAHALLGSLLGILEYDWAGAERSFDKALQLSPGSSIVLLRHAWHFLVPKLRIAEALAQMRRAVTHDPLSPYLHSIFGLILTVAHEYDPAVAECRTALELAPEFNPARWFLGAALILQGKKDEGLVECRKVLDLWGIRPMVAAGMCVIYGMLGRANEAQKMFAEFTELARKAWVPQLAYAWAYLGLHDERVFEWLEKAIDARDPAVTHMPSMPIYDSIREDPRFRKLLAKMDLA